MKYLFYSIFILLNVGCYSFTGSSLSPEVKTIQIKNFPNNAALVNVNLSQQFTTDLQNRFLQRTTLKGSNDNPHIVIEGEIVGYDITPTNITNTTSGPNSVQAAQNKLTITIKLRYRNSVDPKLNFERTYSDEASFDSNLDINAIENEQVKIVNERIINKIYNDIVANW